MGPRTHDCLGQTKKIMRTTAISLLLWATPSYADLSFNQALSIALQTAPELQASAAQLDAAQQNAIPAGALPDPKLAVGINNMPIEGNNRFSTSADFMTMRQIGVMQEFPNRAKRRARQAEANSEIDLAAINVQLDTRQILSLTAQSWIQLHALEQQLVVLEQLDKENNLLTKTHEASHTGKQSMVMDTLIPEEENALLQERRDELLRLHSRARAQLQRWLGDAALQPLSGRAPEWPLSLSDLEHSLAQNPEFLRYEPMTQKLDAQVAAARAAKRPDWGVEVMYGARGYPAEDMLSLKFTVDLPVFTRSRQNPRIAASLSERAAIDSERDVKLRNLKAELISDYADYQQLARAYSRQRDIFLPLADKKIALIQAAWQGNNGMGLTDVIHARQARLDAQFKLIQIGAAQDQIAAQIYFRYGIQKAEIAQLKQNHTIEKNSNSTNEYTPSREVAP